MILGKFVVKSSAKFGNGHFTSTFKITGKVSDIDEERDLLMEVNVLFDLSLKRIGIELFHFVDQLFKAHHSRRQFSAHESTKVADQVKADLTCSGKPIACTEVGSKIKKLEVSHQLRREVMVSISTS